MTHSVWTDNGCRVRTAKHKKQTCIPRDILWLLVNRPPTVFWSNLDWRFACLWSAGVQPCLFCVAQKTVSSCQWFETSVAVGHTIFNQDLWSHQPNDMCRASFPRYAPPRSINRHADVAGRIIGVKIEFRYRFPLLSLNCIEQRDIAESHCTDRWKNIFVFIHTAPCNIQYTHAV